MATERKKKSGTKKGEGKTKVKKIDRSAIAEARDTLRQYLPSVDDALSRLRSTVSELDPESDELPQEIAESEFLAKDGEKTIGEARKELDNDVIDFIDRGGKVEEGDYTAEIKESERRSPSWQKIACDEHHGRVAAETLLEEAYEALSQGSSMSKSRRDSIKERITKFFQANTIDEGVEAAVVERADETYVSEIKDDTPKSVSRRIEVKNGKNGKK